MGNNDCHLRSFSTSPDRSGAAHDYDGYGGNVCGFPLEPIRNPLATSVGSLLDSEPVSPKGNLLAPLDGPSVFHEICSDHDFAAFYISYYRRLIYYCRTKHISLEDAQDLTQETFLVLWQKREELHPPYQAFLFGIARRLYYAMLRKRRNDALILDESHYRCVRTIKSLRFAVLESTPSDDVMMAVLLSQIATLSQNQQKVIKLIYVEGVSRIKAAEKLGISRRTLRTHEKRALDILSRISHQNN